MESAIPPAVYAAMLGATIAGQFLGMAVDAFAVGRRVVWIPLAFSLVLEALVGARFAAARLGHPLTAPERRKLTINYSLALVGISLPLALWIAISKSTGEASEGVSAGISPADASRWLVVVVFGAVLYTAARYGLMSLFSRRAT